MKYPKLLQKGDTIGICAPSSGVSKDLFPRLDSAIANIKLQGYSVCETASVRTGADEKIRAQEFMRLYEDPCVAAILPPWGGEFLMEILPLLDFEKIATLTPKWISGYSDITTLTFPITIHCDLATIHGSNAMNMGGLRMDDSDRAVFEVMSLSKTTQSSFPFYCGSWPDFPNPLRETYCLSEPSIWKLLHGTSGKIAGRLIGGCMDTLSVLVGTKYADIAPFLEKYKSDGFVWTLESCEMTAAEIYRALWQMRENGWFKHCNGVIYGRPAGYSDTNDFTLVDALEQGLGGLNVPVIYDADLGHVPPIWQIVNGSFGSVEFDNGRAKITQELRT